MIITSFESNRPEYLSHYGMHRAPFSDSVENDMFYAEPTRAQRLDILLHLAQYGSELLLVTGEPGSGKTTLLEQFLQKAHDTWLLCRINAHSRMTEEQLVHKICNGFKIPIESTRLDPQVINIKRRLDAMMSNTPTIVLCVDNAHLLSVESMRYLLDISNTHNNIAGCTMRVILFCQPQIKITLANPDLQDHQKQTQRKIDLPPLSHEETANYLRYRLSKAGNEEQHLLTESSILKIYNQSCGVPARINKTADTLFYETTPIIRRAKNVEEQAKNKSRIKRTLYLVIMISLLTTGFAYHRPINSWLQEHYTSVTGFTLPVRSGKEMHKTPSNKQAAPTPESADLATAENAVSNGTPEHIDAHDNQTQGSETLSVSNASNSNMAYESIAEQVQMNPSGPTMHSVKDDQWILSQNPAKFTLQLVTGHHQSTIIKFIKEHKLEPDELAYYYANRDGKNWHNLVYGLYKDRKEAVIAAKTLPPALAATQPWIRNIESIQIDIYRNQQ